MIKGACRCVVCVLLLVAVAAPQTPTAENSAEPTLNFVILSDQHPLEHFPVAPEIVASKPAALFVSITKVVNPKQTPIEIFTYLAQVQKPGAKGEGAHGLKILVGKFVLYPPDRPARFQLNSADAFRKLEGSRAATGEIQLLVEMRRVRESDPWTPVELTLAPPEWRGQHQ
jgi:hypothetical protein